MQDNTLWYIKHRPRTLNDYVFQSPEMKALVEKIIAKKHIGNLLLIGRPGTGKSALAKLIVEEIGIPDVDFKIVDGSINTGVDEIRDNVYNFSQSSSYGTKGKVVLIEEADYLTNNAEASLRNIMGEESTTASFILTANYSHKIAPATFSRSTVIEFDTMSEDDFLMRLIKILDDEQVSFTEEVLFAHYEKHYPDLRKTIGSLEASVDEATRTLGMPMQATTSQNTEWMENALVLFLDGNITEGRKTVLENITYEDYEYFYELLYKNVDIFAQNNQEKRDACIIAIADSMAQDMAVANREINLSACMAKLTRIYNR